MTTTATVCRNVATGVTRSPVRTGEVSVPPSAQYDFTMTTTNDDGRVTVGFGAYAWGAPLSSVDDGASDPEGDFARVAGLAFNSVNIAKGPSATAQALLTLHRSAGSAGQTFTVWGISNATLSTSTTWSTAHAFPADFSPKKTTASATFVTVGDSSDMVCNITAIVNEVLNSTNWASGNTLRLYMENEADGAEYTFLSSNASLVIQ